MKNKFGKILSLGAASLVSVILAVMPINAQELSESHLSAAKSAIKATSATSKLNDILPTAAARLTGQLIGNRPDIETEITLIVNETAIELAARRGDLQKEAEKIYARVFSEQDLKGISEFFSTDAGQKFLKELPLVIREVDKASRIWGTGINRDLAKTVGEKMKAAGLQ